MPEAKADRFQPFGDRRGRDRSRLGRGLSRLFGCELRDSRFPSIVVSMMTQTDDNAGTAASARAAAGGVSYGAAATAGEASGSVMTAIPADGPTTCPMCHTVAAITDQALAAGAGWRCARCGQRWSADRLAAVAAYARYVAVHDCVSPPSLHVFTTPVVIRTSSSE